MTGITGRGARAVWMVAVGVLCAAQSTASAAWADAPDGGMETTHGPSPISNADSWLEIDRTLNVLAPLSKGTAGSDHDGGGGAIEQHHAAPWLDATELRGGDAVTMTDALDAWQSGDRAKARRLVTESEALRERARAVRVDPPRNSWGVVEPKVGDGVLDVFLSQAADRMA
ncbi:MULTISPECIES: hypothetical protein [Streptomyces]|uniref:Secreted protein n=1 Tax=Streptomyces flavovirens TaxID=52258 RepID=A0ABV8MVR4_9ACTN|nr:hypothetical protein [Streptomyces sp. MBT51]MBK3592089.1 hypothetical protein [Streptomyces sp. MBT51]